MQHSYLCIIFALSLHFLCIFFALCAGWLLVDSVSLFMHVLNDSEWMRMACLLNQSVSEPKLEWEWLSNVGITHFEGDFTFDLFFFFFFFLLGSCLLAQQVNFKRGFQMDSFTQSFHLLGITQLQGEFIQAAPNCADSGALQILSIGYRLLTLWSSVSFKTNPLTAVKDVSGSPQDP